MYVHIYAHTIYSRCAYLFYHADIQCLPVCYFSVNFLCLATYLEYLVANVYKVVNVHCAYLACYTTSVTFMIT